MHPDLKELLAGCPAVATPDFVAEFRNQLDRGFQLWRRGEDPHSLAGAAYRFAQDRYRTGTPIDQVTDALEAWRKQQPATFADSYCAFVRHYVIRGYQDAVR